MSLPHPTPSSERITVDIIGAGIGGMATAYFLHRQLGNRVHLRIWEASAELGGLAGAFQTPHYTVEKFYHHMFRRDRALQQLIADLGLAHDLVWRPAATGSYYFRQPYRLSSPLDLLRFKPLPLLHRIRLGLLVLHARTIRHWQQLDDETVEQYITRVSGKRVFETVWRPLLDGKFGPYAPQVSAAWLWCKLVDRGGSRSADGFEVLGYLRGGLGRVFQALSQLLTAAGHEIHLNTPIQALLPHPHRPQALGFLRTAQGVEVPVQWVVSTIHTPQLAAILPDFAAPYRQQLLRIRYLANVCLVLTLNRSLSEFYWTNVTDPAAPFVGIIEQTKWADASDFQSQHVVYISAYVPQTDPRLQATALQLLEQYLPYIRKIFPHFSPEHIIQMHVWKAPYTQPIVHTGYRHSIPAIQSPLPNLLVCTMAQIYPNDRQVSNGIEKAADTARYLCNQLNLSATQP